MNGRLYIHNRQWRGFAIRATLALWLLLPPGIPPIAEGATHVDIVRSRFQQLLDYWGYQEWWSMWEQGTMQSRSGLLKDAFGQRMDSSRWQLACCDKRLRGLRVTPVSSGRVNVSATLLFETKGSPRTVQEQSCPINLNFYLEEEQWRVDLVGLRHPCP